MSSLPYNPGCSLSGTMPYNPANPRSTPYFKNLTKEIPTPIALLAEHMTQRSVALSGLKASKYNGVTAVLLGYTLAIPSPQLFIW